MQAMLSAVTGRPSGDTRELLILDRVSGVLRPSRFTVLLGPPGSGKSCLMKALSGQVKKDKTLKVSLALWPLGAGRWRGQLVKAGILGASCPDWLQLLGFCAESTKRS
jgi:energy-coupling factor transporter ATP-binding protein EcfA2